MPFPVPRHKNNFMVCRQPRLFHVAPALQIRFASLAVTEAKLCTPRSRAGVAIVLMWIVRHCAYGSGEAVSKLAMCAN